MAVHGDMWDRVKTKYLEEGGEDIDEDLEPEEDGEVGYVKKMDELWEEYGEDVLWGLAIGAGPGAVGVLGSYELIESEYEEEDLDDDEYANYVDMFKTKAGDYISAVLEYGSED